MSSRFPCPSLPATMVSHRCSGAKAALRPDDDDPRPPAPLAAGDGSSSSSSSSARSCSLMRRCRSSFSRLLCASLRSASSSSSSPSRSCTCGDLPAALDQDALPAPGPRLGRFAPAVAFGDGCLGLGLGDAAVAVGTSGASVATALPPTSIDCRFFRRSFSLSAAFFSLPVLSRANVPKSSSSPESESWTSSRFPIVPGRSSRANERAINPACTAKRPVKMWVLKLRNTMAEPGAADLWAAPQI
eukprot:scaffold11878_cov75-Phaeocystis_antarctica.AAC.1